jgi:deoxyribonuclease-4
MALRRAGKAGADAVQLFTAPPEYYGDRLGMRPERAARFREELRAVGIAAERVLVHAPYVLNLASPDPAKYARSRAGLAKELERSTALGVLALCFHPGSAGNGDLQSAIARVGDAITFALEAVPGSTQVLVENAAGAGRTVGRSAAEIAAILARVPSHLRERTGYGLDTCHLFASGHDIGSGPAQLRRVLDEFSDTIGRPPAFFHLNDSQAPMASNRDRHALIGEGAIGTEPFRWLLADPRTLGVPLILETPLALPEPQANADAADGNVLRMLALLRELGAGSTAEERMP